MAEFHETGYGRKYYDHQLPELIKQLTRIADTLTQINNFIISDPIETLNSNSDEKSFRSNSEL